MGHEAFAEKRNFLMKLNSEGLENRMFWQKNKYTLPEYDREKVIDNTKRNPVWIHFGAGNIFRALLASMQEELLNKGIEDKGIIVAEGFDYEIIDKAYRPFDNLSILVTLRSNGDVSKKIIGSVAESLKADPGFEEDWKRLREIFENPSLQMVSFTITEKAYGDTSKAGVMYKIAELCYYRFLKGRYPISLVSMDNCKDNGGKLHNAIMQAAKIMVEKRSLDPDFLEYLADESKITYPYTMIDKITPRPDEGIKDMLAADGLEDIDIHITGKNTYVSAFVNAEAAEYLVIEDRFTHGRPKLEERGVIFTDSNTVALTEKMKVCTCLNPLHTALAVFGCLFGYRAIHETVRDEVLHKLINTLAYKEGLPVVADPVVIDPIKFLKEVIEDRFPNPFIKDTPQRIATDTSQKLSIRFGETIKSYTARGNLDVNSLIAIPLVFAGWCRYLMGIDDEGRVFNISSDPLLEKLKGYVKDIKLGDKGPFRSQLRQLLSDESIFGVNLYDAGLGNKVEMFFESMVADRHAVRNTIIKVLNTK